MFCFNLNIFFLKTYRYLRQIFINSIMPTITIIIFWLLLNFFIHFIFNDLKIDFSISYCLLCNKHSELWTYYHIKLLVLIWSKYFSYSQLYWNNHVVNFLCAISYRYQIYYCYYIIGYLYIHTDIRWLQMKTTVTNILVIY